MKNARALSPLPFPDRTLARGKRPPLARFYHSESFAAHINGLQTSCFARHYPLFRLGQIGLAGRVAPMVQKIHFVSGLPRAGSTLLCALLRQNHRFAAAMTSPVASLVNTLLPKMSGVNEFAVFFDDVRRRTVLRGIFDALLCKRRFRPVVFDTNRTWTAKAALLSDLYPEARIICCVRDISWIIDSIEKMLRKNSLQVSRMFSFQPGSSVYAVLNC